MHLHVTDIAQLSLIKKKQKRSILSVPISV